MLYRLTLNCIPENTITQNNFYYSILGGVMNLFANDKQIYEQIIKISYQVTGKNLEINLTINGQESYNQIISKLIGDKLSLRLNNSIFTLTNIKLDFHTYDVDNLIYKPFNKFVLRFFSPTFVKQTNITHILPEASNFIGSIARKLNKLGMLDLDMKIFDEASKSLYIGECKLWSETVKIKRGIKVGIRGFATYYTKNYPPELLPMLHKILLASSFVGIGNSSKLGLGNTSCNFFYY